MCPCCEGAPVGWAWGGSPPTPTRPTTPLSFFLPLVLATWGLLDPMAEEAWRVDVAWGALWRWPRGILEGQCLPSPRQLELASHRHPTEEWHAPSDESQAEEAGNLGRVSVGTGSEASRAPQKDDGLIEV